MIPIRRFAFAAICFVPVPGSAQERVRRVQAPPPTDFAAALARAAAPGYRMLLRQLHEPVDRERFGEFDDHGLLAVGRYKTHRDLPTGHWVYSYPCWYIWRDKKPFPVKTRSYGPEQATGAPNVTVAGDSANAWCPKLQDTRAEWLLVELPAPILATEIHVRENYTPGSVARITLFTLDGREVDAWRNPRIGPVDVGIRTLKSPVHLGFRTARIKLYLRPADVPGWQEIDAVGVADHRGVVHWARSVAASTTYAAARKMPAAPTVGPLPAAKRAHRSVNVQPPAREATEDRAPTPGIRIDGIGSIDVPGAPAIEVAANAETVALRAKAKRLEEENAELRRVVEKLRRRIHALERGR